MSHHIPVVDLVDTNMSRTMFDDHSTASMELCLLGTKSVKIGKRGK